MATPTQPNNPGPSRESIVQTREALKALIEDQGDFNNLLKNADKELAKLQTTYNKIAAKVDTMSRGTLNVKEINKELKNLAEKEYLAKRKVADLEKGLSQRSKEQLDTQKQLNVELEQARRIEDRSTRIRVTRDIAERSRLNVLSMISNIELQNLEYHKKMAKISEEEVNFSKDILNQELETAKYLGISGNLMKKFADTLGVGENAYNAMTEAARGTVDETGKLTRPTKWEVLKVGLRSIKKSIKENLDDPMVKAGLIIGGIVGSYKLLKSGLDAVGSGAKKAMSMLGGEGGPITNIAGTFSGMLKNIPLVGGLLAGVVDSFAMLLDFAVGAKSQIHEMGRQIGLSADESVALSNHYHDVSIASGKAYLNNKVLLKTQIDINKELGITNKISDSNVKTAYELMKFAGIELDTVTKIEQISKITGKSQSNIAGAVMHQVNNFKRLTGVGLSFQGIMKEVANLSGYLGLKLAKYPGEIIKSVVAAKGLGLELKQLDSMADSFLDFEGSISREMEAQILTGKEINLNRARELFLNNQLVEAGVELSKQLGSSKDFLNMNRIAAESFAQSMGMSRDQVADMLKQQEYFASFEVKSVKELQKKVALMKEQGKAQEAINMLGSEETFNKLVAADATADLAGFIEKIKESFAALVANTKLADLVQNFITFLSQPDNITSILNRIKDVFGSIVSVVGSVVGGIMRALNGLAGSWVGEWMGMSDFHIDEDMINTVVGAGAQIKSFDMGNLSANVISPNAAKNAAQPATAAAVNPYDPRNNASMGTSTIVVKTYLDNRPIGLGTTTFNNQTPKNDGTRLSPTP